MDFGVVSHKHNASCLGSNEPGEGKGHGSANLKHRRSGLAADNNNNNNNNNNNSNSWRLSKMPRPGEVDFSSKKASEHFSSPFGRSNLWPSPDDDDGQKMLSFSSDEPHCGGGGGGSSRSIAFSICEDEQYLSKTGGGGPSGGIRGPFARLKGPFTPSQWMELEHQALIYKHIMANVPVPSNLLVPLKRSLYSYGSPGPYASNLLGWGPFHLGYSGSNDPEPGRCRRTDGKKWRCSRDAVPDQKYCERHINRGRHRSRKPVEGHNTVGHANLNANVSSSSSKVPPIPTNNNAPSSSSSGPVNNASSNNNSLGAMQRQFSSFQQQQQPSSTNNLDSRSQGFQGLSLVPPTIGLKTKDSPPFSVQKQHATFQESSSSSPHSEFGIVSSDSLLNPSERIIPYMNTNTSDSFLQFNSKETRNHQHPVHHFIDDWTKADDHQSEELKSDWTQLSMSIPTMAAPDSPAQPKPISSLRLLSHELDPFHMSLGVSRDIINEPMQKQPAWLPVTWGNPVGGPLGEVLSAQLGSSPTGVLQKSTFVSFSNSSSVSSPTSGDNNRKSDLLVSSAPIPSL
ncbi:growth-regulating factor 1 [Phtheirospermum japonicum]|uniref:Growth-regulating factor n=1 Tax=Phtheirospermum japonicum TaxID=374723 RepID=A0A830CTW3_9LAMI|nr:growth-regulating factor 1 [Phtheirospermum japonicum]